MATPASYLRRACASSFSASSSPSLLTFTCSSAERSASSASRTSSSICSLRSLVFTFSARYCDADSARRASQYRAEKVKTNDLKEQIELDVRLALDALRSAEEQVKVSKEGLELAENELAQARRRYEAGVAIGVEVTDAQSRLERARDNQTMALYNYNVGRIDLAQAMGAVRQVD